MNFYDVFGGTGTVTANMAGFIKGTRYFNEYDASVANFIWHCSRDFSLMKDILDDYKTSDIKLTEYYAKSEYLITKELDKIGYMPIHDMKDTAKDIANNPDYTVKKSKDGREILLDTKYERKIDVLFDATLNNIENGNKGIAKRLQIELELLSNERVKS